MDPEKGSALSAPVGVNGDPLTKTDKEKYEKDMDEEKYEKETMPEMRYGINDIPPWYEAIFLGIQHYLTMLGATVLIPNLLVPAMGGSKDDLAKSIQTIFFVSGLNTLLQTTFGTRLPIVIGGSFSFLTPVLVIAANFSNVTEDRFKVTMRAVQGALIGASGLHIVLGFTGLMGPFCRFISPITIAPTIAMIGLALYSAGFPAVGNCVEVGLVQIVLVILFSQYLKNVQIFGYRVFQLFPVLLGLTITWVYAVVLTEAGAYDNVSTLTRQHCRTDQTDILKTAPWFRVPYPFQWGWPTFDVGYTFAVVAGALAALIESTGDFYACARISGATPPPPGVIARGVGWEGIGILLDGIWGTGNGSTTYAENIGAIGITRVGSRRVVQVGACFMILFGIIGKFGALFASIPGPIVGGLFCVMFGIITAVGLSNLQFANMNNPRNLFIVGFALYMGLSVPAFFTTFAAGNPEGKYPVNTGSTVFNQIMNTIFTTNMAVSMIAAFFLDNTIPASRRDRGMHVWDNFRHSKTDPRTVEYYSLPWGLSRYFKWAWWVGI